MISSLKPPTASDDLAWWFAEAVHAEIAELEKKGGEQRFELHAGQRVTGEQSPYAIYRFLLADNTLVPEDASGTIDIVGRQFKASVVARETSRIDVQIDGADALGAFVARAILRVEDLGLLRKLTEILEAIAAGAAPVSALATSIFHPKSIGTQKLSLPMMPALNRVKGEQRLVLEQACASEITFVWGPPGTGKTYVIAHLITALVARGERVLMASHTHAAVDQLMFETVKPADSTGNSNAGPLANSDLEREGKIVRIGLVPSDSKVPPQVRLDNIVERKAEGVQAEIIELHRRANLLAAKRVQLRAQMAEWDRLSDLQQRLVEAEQSVKQAVSVTKERRAELAQAKERVEEHRRQVEAASRAWFFRERKVEQAREVLNSAEHSAGIVSKVVDDALASGRAAERAAELLQSETKNQIAICGFLPTAEVLKEHLEPVDAELNQIERRRVELTARLDALEKEVITNACVIAATLTKCYVGNQLEGQLFDALIVDEISMALPPLLFVAARLAHKRVILVGDFKQLPPIVRSDSEVADRRLGTDAFQLAGLADEALEPTDHTALTRLSVQRRMLPCIADAARAISYGPKNLVDDPSVLQRPQPPWLTFLPSNALVIVDTADVHCWCGRQAGSLSRFNLYSAQIAAELAAKAATGIRRPDSTVSPPIGIVTPYAAQRRLLSRLIQALELEVWVDVGTVHTFQGGEAELIIFDSVLDEPYWTARMCNPKQSQEVRRDLNVALTRARSKFVLVGSSEWLNRHAKPTSGIGQLWHYLKDHADLVSAYDLVEAGFADRVADLATNTYRIPIKDDGPVLERLDENTFSERFARDLRDATESIFGHIAFFGSYRWPQIEPLFRAALERGVEVTLVTPAASDAANNLFVEKTTRALRQQGAVVVAASGLHGKDIIIDSRVLYTGSLNVASHRGTSEDVHRIDAPEYVRTCLEFMQAKHVRLASKRGNQPRTCPQCSGPTQVVNQSRSMSQWDKQPMKIGCAEYQTTGCKFLVDIDQRPPFAEPPRCSVDKRTKYRRVKRGRGESWECPKHPKQCERFKVVLGDP